MDANPIKVIINSEKVTNEYQCILCNIPRLLLKRQASAKIIATALVCVFVDISFYFVCLHSCFVSCFWV